MAHSDGDQFGRLGDDGLHRHVRRTIRPLRQCCDESRDGSACHGGFVYAFLRGSYSAKGMASMAGVESNPFGGGIVGDALANSFFDDAAGAFRNPFAGRRAQSSRPVFVRFAGVWRSVGGRQVLDSVAALFSGAGLQSRGLLVLRSGRSNFRQDAGNRRRDARPAHRKCHGPPSPGASRTRVTILRRISLPSAPDSASLRGIFRHAIVLSPIPQP
jgi:hypothetical protein